MVIEAMKTIQKPVSNGAKNLLFLFTHLYYPSRLTILIRFDNSFIIVLINNLD